MLIFLDALVHCFVALSRCLVPETNVNTLRWGANETKRQSRHDGLFESWFSGGNGNVEYVERGKWMILGEFV